MNSTVVYRYLGYVKLIYFWKKLCRAHEKISRAHDLLSQVHDISSRAHVWAHGRAVATVIQTTISWMRGQCSTKWGTQRPCMFSEISSKTLLLEVMLKIISIFLKKRFWKGGVSYPNIEIKKRVYIKPTYFY